MYVACPGDYPPVVCAWSYLQTNFCLVCPSETRGYSRSGPAGLWCNAVTRRLMTSTAPKHRFRENTIAQTNQDIYCLCCIFCWVMDIVNVNITAGGVFFWQEKTTVLFRDVLLGWLIQIRGSEASVPLGAEKILSTNSFFSSVGLHCYKSPLDWLLGWCQKETTGLDKQLSVIESSYNN